MRGSTRCSFVQMTPTKGVTGQSRYLPGLLAGSATFCKYSVISEGTQNSSLTSCCGSHLNWVLVISKGLVYVFGSLIVTVISNVLWSTRVNRSCTLSSVLRGCPNWSIQALSSAPAESTTKV